VKCGLILLILITVSCWSQTTTGKAETKGPCSPAVTGSKNTLVIKCQGLTKKQGEEILKLLNKLVRDPNHGFLAPSNDSFPPSSCPPGSIPEGITRVYWGSNMAVIRPEMPFSIVSIAGNPMLWGQITPEGLKISGIMYSEDGAVAFFADNEFWLNANISFHSENPDTHTLIVRDKWAQEVLHIRYVNPQAISVTGRFYYPGRPPVIIDEGAAHIGQTVISGDCNLGHYGAAISIK